MKTSKKGKPKTQQNRTQIRLLESDNIDGPWTEFMSFTSTAQSNNDAYILSSKAIDLSNGILTRKRLKKAITKSEPVSVRYNKPSPQRLYVHIQDILILIEKLSANEGVTEETVKMFGRYVKEHQGKTPKIDLS